MPDNYPQDPGQQIPPIDPAVLQQALGAQAAGPLPGSAFGPPPPVPASASAPPPDVQQQSVNLGSTDNAPQDTPGGTGGQPPRPSYEPLIETFAKQLFGKGLQGIKVPGGTGQVPTNDAGQVMMGKEPQMPMRPASRLDAFESFLGNFLYSFSQGMEKGGTGPGANARGFGIAANAPYQQQLQQYQLGQQQQQEQAQVGLQQAEAQRTRAQAQMVPVQIGSQTIYMPPEYAKNVLSSQIGAQSRENVANINAQTKRFMATSFGVFDKTLNGGKGGYISGAGQGGPMGTMQVTPELAKEWGLPDQLIGSTQKISDMSNLGKMIQQGTGIAQGSEGAFLVNKMVAEATGGRAGITPLGQGSPAANPLAVAKYNLAKAVFDRDTFGTAFGKDIPSSLVDAKGNTLGWKSPAGPTASIKQQAQQAEDLSTLFKDVKSELATANAQGKLGPYAARINDLLTGTIGFNDPEFAKLRALGSLTASGVLKMHFGARGGQDMYNHFENLFNTGQMTYGDLVGALDGFQVFTDRYAARVRTAGAKNGGAGGGGASNAPQIHFTPIPTTR